MAETIAIEIRDGDDVYRFAAPRSWNDMSRKQLFGWCGVLDGFLDRDDALNTAVLMFYNMPDDLFARLPEPMLYHLRETLSYLEEVNLTKNVIGTLWILGRRYYGPGNRLANISIAEYRRTEIYYQLYQKTKRREFLLLLAATLYRPRGGKDPDDPRRGIDERSIQRRADFFRWAMHRNTLRSILLFYEGCRQEIIRKHPKVYPKMSIDVDNGPFAKRENKEIIDMEDHILAFAGGKLGNYAETAKCNVYLFLKNKEHRIEEVEALKNKK